MRWGGRIVLVGDLVLGIEFSKLYSNTSLIIAL